MYVILSIIASIVFNQTSELHLIRSDFMTGFVRKLWGKNAQNFYFLSFLIKEAINKHFPTKS